MVTPDFLTFGRMLSIICFQVSAACLCAETVKTPRFKCEIRNSVESTIISAMPENSEQSVILRLDWKSGEKSPEGFQKTKSKGNISGSTHRFGKTTVTRTILVSEKENAIFVHALADQPGAINLAAKFETSKPVKVANRRNLVLTARGIAADAWVIPYESDTEEKKNSIITVLGEGEILIIFSLSASPAKAVTRDTLQRLGKKFDPENDPPSPHLIWEGVQPNK